MLNTQLFNSTLKITLLVTLPQLLTVQYLCSVEYLTPLQYIIKGQCYTGPLTHQDLVLLSCSGKRYILPSHFLSKCFQREDVFLCEHNLLSHAINNTDWLGLSWAPRSHFSFPRTHQPSTLCDRQPPFYHLGGRYYLATRSDTITATSNHTSRTLNISPLMIFHLPCDFQFSLQETGFGPCPRTLKIHVPIFTTTSFTYVPWETAADDHVLTLHYDSLHIPPPLKFNSTTLHSLDKTYELIDGRLGKTLQQVRTDISKIKETYETSLNDTLTYIAFGCSIFSVIVHIIILRYLCNGHSAYSARPPLSLLYTAANEHDTHLNPSANSVPLPSDEIELAPMATCETCHKPQISQN